MEVERTGGRRSRRRRRREREREREKSLLTISR